MSNVKVNDDNNSLGYYSHRTFVEREAYLVRHLATSGIVSLKRSGFGIRSLGEYYNAFFGLSHSIERLTKLILVADHVFQNRDWPSGHYIRKHRHDLEVLINKVKHIGNRRMLRNSLEYKYPDTRITETIVENLSAFAKGTGRYANFSIILDNIKIENDPIQKWRSDVGVEILRSHYAGEVLEKKHSHQVAALMNIYGEQILHSIYSEKCPEAVKTTVINITRDQDKIINDQQHYYTLLIIRWLVCLYVQISGMITHNTNMKYFYDTRRALGIYLVPDDKLREIQV